MLSMRSSFGVHLGMDWNATLELDVEERDWLLETLAELVKEFKSSASKTG